MNRKECFQAFLYNTTGSNESAESRRSRTMAYGLQRITLPVYGVFLSEKLESDSRTKFRNFTSIADASACVKYSNA